MKPNILIIVFKGIGDVILTIPVIKAIKKEIPQSKIYFLTRKFASKVLENNPLISEIIIREEKPLLKILKIKPDITIDYMLSSSSGGFSLFSGAKTRIAFYRPWGRIFYNKMVKSNFDGYTVIRRFELLKPLGINPQKITDIKPDIYYTSKNEDKVNKWFNENNINAEKDKIVTFDITSPRTYRLLPPDKIILLANKLSKENGFKSIFLAGPGEESYVQTNLNKYSKEKTYYAFNLDLLDLAYLISRAKIHIGTSSSPMHIAVSQNTPTFTIYNTFTPMKSWSPPLKIHSGIECNFNKIEMEEIYNKLINFINEIKI